MAKGCVHEASPAIAPTRMLLEHGSVSCSHAHARHCIAQAITWLLVWCLEQCAMLFNTCTLLPRNHITPSTAHSNRVKRIRKAEGMRGAPARAQRPAPGSPRGMRRSATGTARPHSGSNCTRPSRSAGTAPRPPASLARRTAGLLAGQPPAQGVPGSNNVRQCVY